MQLFPIFAAALGLGQGVYSAMIVLDCTNFPQSCNNDCYGIFGAPDQPADLHWDMPTTTVEDDRRKGSGCTMSSGLSACNDNSGIAPYNKDGETCDEYPYASTTQGGMAGAALRCLSRSDNSAEGAYLKSNLYEKATADGGCGNAACDFSVGFNLNTVVNSPLCMNISQSTRPANDGHEFKLNSGGGYGAAKRDVSASDLYVSFMLANGTRFPMYLRREFLMANGMRVMLGSKDLNKVISAGMIVATDGEATFVVRELFGQEKTPALRPPIKVPFVA